MMMLLNNIVTLIIRVEKNHDLKKKIGFFYLNQIVF